LVLRIGDVGKEGHYGHQSQKLHEKRSVYRRGNMGAVCQKRLGQGKNNVKKGVDINGLPNGLPSNWQNRRRELQKKGAPPGD